MGLPHTQCVSQKNYFTRFQLDFIKCFEILKNLVKEILIKTLFRIIGSWGLRVIGLYARFGLL